ncbi:MAG: hypothetical protein AMXMBFR37_19470 [Steroidobacteraceae bacterium]
MPASAAPWLAAAIACAAPARAFAIDALTLHVDQVVAGASTLGGVDARLVLGDAAQPSVSIGIARLRPGAGQPELRQLQLRCASVVIADPRFGCADAHLDAGHTPVGPVSIALGGEYDTARSTGHARAVIAKLAGGRLAAQGRYAAGGWRLDGQAAGLQIAALRALLAPWFAVPEGWEIAGDAAIEFAASGRGAPAQAEATLALTSIDLSNAESTIIAEGASATLTARLEAQSAGGYALDATLEGRKGQALAGPALLDLDHNPLTLRAQGRLAGEALELTRIDVTAPQLIDAHGTARLTLGAAPALERAHFAIDSLEFPAAYTSLMQITLAATDFGDLVTSGRASGAVDLAANAVERIALTIDDLSMYNDRAFFMKHVQGEVRWAAAAGADVSPSWLAWTEGGAYGLSGGASRVEFVTRAAGFMLLEPWHMPVFDGAIDIRTLAVTDLGGPGMSLRFDAQIDPISMQPLCRAFGWPEFSGQISGRVPGVELDGNELRVKGDIEAQVFDGSFVASNLRLSDPFGKWPRFFADLRGRGLDLELVTRTFAVGSITGRLDVDVLGLELFAWSPVAFDARLETPPGDRSRHRISARAVSELSNVGGGGGGVTSALQSGVLQFFDEYGYDRLGIRCRLANDVCLMSGVEPAPNGYYIVKGRGLPRIDIVGNQGRVNWPQLVSQIVSGMASAGDVVVE